MVDQWQLYLWKSDRLGKAYLYCMLKKINKILMLTSDLGKILSLVVTIVEYSCRYVAQYYTTLLK